MLKHVLKILLEIESDLPLALKRFSDDRQAVRILTIHKKQRIRV